MTQVTRIVEGKMRIHENGVDKSVEHTNLDMLIRTAMLVEGWPINLLYSIVTTQNLTLL